MLNTIVKQGFPWERKAVSFGRKGFEAMTGAPGGSEKLRLKIPHYV